MTDIRHRTSSGRFGVIRDEYGLVPVHIPSGLRVGMFSHLSVRTFKAALAGLERVEAGMGRLDLELLDAPTDSHLRLEWPQAWRVAVRRLRDRMEEAFPNGAWWS